mmetsp:Transcript_4005/g.5284  ORF Transcript_4005/g.5284 Transcript_4005/m.5284 type:complete len:182 (+) Transcript_4005:15-560(+)|eukprot:CAMPEP_0114386658 /NCGR_PEP_ID=MMETSP0102-20121206/6763_1 /TAXON_ID=38822 ORGANISM="Pteridomonas danica, Strain PT" /NCGR_SAMPLE_ID=MMETSP0102 /ASSEMBLY_ACC=CAM_ASM_000212 /LENGTH=181 /DNA_ID=CAMNT_0001543547 /DNA_START=15 /DNA_END=560 /DNA_ORIENTATION=+
MVSLKSRPSLEIVESVVTGSAAVNMILGGVFYCATLNFEHFIMGIYIIIVGLAVLFLKGKFEFYDFSQMSVRWFPFLYHAIGRAAFYLYVGCSLLFGGTPPGVCGFIVICLGFIEICLYGYAQYTGQQTQSFRSSQEVIADLESANSPSNSDVPVAFTAELSNKESEPAASSSNEPAWLQD